MGDASPPWLGSWSLSGVWKCCGRLRPSPTGDMSLFIAVRTGPQVWGCKATAAQAAVSAHIRKCRKWGLAGVRGAQGQSPPAQFLCSGTSAVAWTAAATCWCMSPSEQHVPERQCVVTPTLEAPSCPGLCLVTSSEVAVPRVLTGCVMLEHSPGSRWVCPGQAQDWEYRAVPGSWTEGQALGC